jgi:hypothetical protein
MRLPRLRILRLRNRPLPHRLQHLCVFFLRHSLLRFKLTSILFVRILDTLGILSCASIFEEAFNHGTNIFFGQHL